LIVPRTAPSWRLATVTLPAPHDRTGKPMVDGITDWVTVNDW
jgi:hypothetical protein